MLGEMLKAGVALEGQLCGSWIVGDKVQVVDKVCRLNEYQRCKKARMAVYDIRTVYTCHPTRRFDESYAQSDLKSSTGAMSMCQVPMGQTCLRLLHLGNIRV